MEITNKTAHANCFCYEGHVAVPTVEVRQLECGHEEEQIFHRNEIAFMTEGEVHYTLAGCPGEMRHGGEFIFIPMGEVFHFAVSKRTVVVVVRLNECITFCRNFHIEDLYRRTNTPGGECPPETHVLAVNRPLRHFLRSLDEAVRNGLCCRHYFDYKTRELFILLRAYYSDEQLRNFFSFILTPNIRFSEAIRTTHHLYHTVGELAESVNMNLKHFEKVFRRIFGMPPGRWMNREKAAMIRHELCAGVKTLVQISDEYGFASQQQLSRFCKREMGLSPREIQGRST